MTPTIPLRFFIPPSSNDIPLPCPLAALLSPAALSPPTFTFASPLPSTGTTSVNRHCTLQGVKGLQRRKRCGLAQLGLEVAWNVPHRQPRPGAALAMRQHTTFSLEPRRSPLPAHSLPPGQLPEQSRPRQTPPAPPLGTAAAAGSPEAAAMGRTSLAFLALGLLLHCSLGSAQLLGMRAPQRLAARVQSMAGRAADAASALATRAAATQTAVVSGVQSRLMAKHPRLAAMFIPPVAPVCLSVVEAAAKASNFTIFLEAAKVGRCSGCCAGCTGC